MSGRELADFEPSTGHQHDCANNNPDGSIDAVCGCLGHLYAIAQDAEVALAAERDRAVAEALAGVRTHNGTPVTAKNLRWAATHEALCRSFIYDVLTGLAAALPDEPEGEA